MKVTFRIHSRLKARIVGSARDAANATLVRAIPVAVDVISRIADSKLEGTATIYKEALRDAITVSKGILRVELTGVAKDLEVGFPARDMKPDLLKSPSAKQGKNGKYVDIPFTHVMSKGPQRTQGMPQAIKAKVQAATRAERISARHEQRPERNPLRVTGTMAGRKNEQERFSKRGKTKQVAVQHKTSVFSQMMRTKLGSSSRYSTIRRISASSDAQSWWHPGFRGIRALKEVKPELEATLKLMFKQELIRKGLKSK